MKIIIKAALIIVGALLLIGSPGACDCGIITYGQAMLQAAIGLGLFGIAGIIKTGEKDDGKHK